MGAEYWDRGLERWRKRLAEAVARQGPAQPDVVASAQSRRLDLRCLPDSVNVPFCHYLVSDA